MVYEAPKPNHMGSMYVVVHLPVSPHTMLSIPARMHKSAHAGRLLGPRATLG